MVCQGRFGTSIRKTEKGAIFQGGAANNDRMMMIGWVKDYYGNAGPGIGEPGRAWLTRLTLLREVNWDTKSQNLVSNPVAISPFLCRFLMKDRLRTNMR